MSVGFFVGSLVMDCSMWLRFSWHSDMLRLSLSMGGHPVLFATERFHETGRHSHHNFLSDKCYGLNKGLGHTRTTWVQCGVLVGCRLDHIVELAERVVPLERRRGRVSITTGTAAITLERTGHGRNHAQPNAVQLSGVDGELDKEGGRV